MTDETQAWEDWRTTGWNTAAQATDFGRKPPEGGPYAPCGVCQHLAHKPFRCTGKNDSCICNFGAPKPKSAPPLNQCDGCRRGMPLKDGLHRAPGYDFIGCTAERYTKPEPAPPLDEGGRT